MRRSEWHRRSNAMVFAWLAVAGTAALVMPAGDHSRWLTVHALLLGAATNAIVIWSWHFACAVLFLPARSRVAESVRLGVLNCGVLLVAVGIVGGDTSLSFGGTALVLAAIVWLGASLWRALHNALPTRFSGTVRGYLWATGMLIAGVLVGSTLGHADPPPGRVLAHLSVNLLGWVGITMQATLVTLWPTMLRTPMRPGAERDAARALPVLVAGVMVAAFGYWQQAGLVAAVGLLTYLAGTGLTLTPCLATVRVRRPTSFATWSTLAGVTCGGIAIVLFLATTLAVSIGEPLLTGVEHVLVPVLVGSVLQVLLGALSYLLPVMAGGGPAAMRVRISVADRWYRGRVVVTTMGCLLALVPSPTPRDVGSGLILLGVGTSAGVTLWSLRQPPQE